MSLFRFTERKYLDDFLNGQLSFAKATFYKNESLTSAQRDDEQTRTLRPDLNKHDFFIEGYPIQNLKSIEISHTARDKENNPLQYYFMSFTKFFDPIMYKEFKADVCIEIFNENIFKERLSSVLKMMNWKGYLSEVVYFDPKELQTMSDFLKVIFSKDKKYSYQREYRIALFPPSLDCFKEKRTKINVGDLKDICKVVD